MKSLRGELGAVTAWMSGFWDQAGASRAALGGPLPQRSPRVSYNTPQAASGCDSARALCLEGFHPADVKGTILHPNNSK